MARFLVIFGGMKTIFDITDFSTSKALMICNFSNLFRTIVTLYVHNYSFYLAVVAAIGIFMFMSYNFATILV